MTVVLIEGDGASPLTMVFALDTELAEQVVAVDSLEMEMVMVILENVVEGAVIEAEIAVDLLEMEVDEVEDVVIGADMQVEAAINLLVEMEVLVMVVVKDAVQWADADADVL